MSKLERKPHIVLAVTGDISADFAQFPCRISTVRNSQDCLKLMHQGAVDVIVGDLKMIEEGVLEKAANDSSDFILIVDKADAAKALGLMQCGVFDYVIRPLLKGELEVRIERAMERRELRKKAGGNEKRVEKEAQSEKLASLSRLVSGMAHEINNPLTAVIGYSQLLLDNGTPPQDSKRQLNVIRDQAMRCGKIIQDLLGFARRRKPQLSPLNLCKIVEIAMEMVEGDCEANHIKVIRSFSGKEVSIRGDGSQLQKVFVSILTNAVHALEKKSGEKRIEVLLTELSNAVEIKIIDNGCGIHEDHMQRIYEPFFTTKEVGKGSGLGLSLCYGFLAEHGGSIHAESRVGYGTTFTVQLPKAELVTEAAVPSPSLNLSATKTVLVVEDEPVVSGFMQQVLMREGYKVEAAYDGSDALEKMLAAEYDVILCDYRIPKMNGFQLYDRICKERPVLAKRFIFVTASLHFAENFGGEDFLVKHDLSYLQKPFSASELLALVQKQLSSRPA